MLHGRTALSLGATSGVHSAEDAIKLLLAGADVVHLCSVLLQKGPAHLAVLQAGLVRWMEEQGFASLDELRGRLSEVNVPDPAGFERANYMQVLDSYSPGRGVRT